MEIDKLLSILMVRFMIATVLCYLLARFQHARVQLCLNLLQNWAELPTQGDEAHPTTDTKLDGDRQVPFSQQIANNLVSKNRWLGRAMFGVELFGFLTALMFFIKLIRHG
ncbi:hypothetical protein KBC79_00465 [Candidatus Woesebacteria bacterium]|nr:hypothetical protein [Candidatus Woesebacteria bacterium]